MRGLMHGLMHGVMRGVMPATTTPFREDGSVDLDRVARHAEWLVQCGCSALVAPGSLGEGQSLEVGERIDLWRAHVSGAGSAPVIAAIGNASTAGACALARAAADAGCRGLMVLPPYVHSGDMREVQLHMLSVARETGLPAMLYNNPAAYRADILPQQVASMAASCDAVCAAKDSSGDSARIEALVRMTVSGDLPESFAACVGLDDGAHAGALVGAAGWVAGLVNALPRESVRLWERATAARSGDSHGRHAAQRESLMLHEWFLPLLKMDTVPDFVQRIKLVQSLVRGDSAWERVRAPRIALMPDDADAVRAAVDRAMATRPDVGGRRA
jgi:dihydrodipicolinate synthase/N-acetylneuraminate lyase